MNDWCYKIRKTWRLGLLLLQRPLSAAQLYASACGAFCPFHVDFIPERLFIHGGLQFKYHKPKCAGWHHSYCCLPAMSLMLWEAQKFQTQLFEGNVAFEDELQWFGRNAGGRFTVEIWATLSAFNTHTLSGTHTLQLQAQTQTDCCPRWQELVSLKTKITFEKEPNKMT